MSGKWLMGCAIFMRFVRGAAFGAVSVMVAGCVLHVLVWASPARGAETPFNFDFGPTNATVTYALKLYEGWGTSGNLVLDLTGSAPAQGNVSGTVWHTGDTIEQIQIASWTGGIATKPIYVDTYLNGSHVELIISDATVITGPSAVLSAGPGGTFHDPSYFSAWGPETDGEVILADLIHYDLGNMLPKYPFHSHVPLDGSVAYQGESLVLGMSYSIADWTYLGNDIPGFDYTAWGGATVTLNVPEPTSLALVALGVLPLLRRRR
jgi:hypothetical protein